MNFSATPYNIGDLEEIYRLTQELDVKLDVAPYMFPPMRKLDNTVNNAVRLSPEEAAEVYVNHCLRTEGVDHFLGRMNSCYQYHLSVLAAEEAGHPIDRSCGIPCRAGSSTWWINWQGRMTNCGMFEEPAYDVLERGFASCWAELRQYISGKCIAKTCANCSKRQFCIVCAASAYAETGQTDGVSPYHCAMTDAFMAEVEKRFGKE